MPFVPVDDSDETEVGGGFVPVAAKMFGEEHPVVGEIPSPYRGMPSKPVVSFPLPTDTDAKNRIFLAPNDDGGLPDVYNRTPDGSFVHAGRFDDGRRAGGQAALPPIDRPMPESADAPKPRDSYATLSQPSMMAWLRSRNPERMKEVDDLVSQADKFGLNPTKRADYKMKAAKIVDEIMPKEGMTMYQSEKTQVEGGRLRNDRPTIIDSDGRVTFFPPLKPRENIGGEVPLDEETLSGMHAEARKQYQKAIAPKSVAGRLATDVLSGAQGVSAALWRPILPQEVSDEVVRNRQAQGQAFDELGSPLERQVGGALQSIGTMAAAAPLAAMSGGAAAPLVLGGAAGLSSANEALTEATDAGVTGSQRLGHAATQGLVEFGTSAVFSKLLQMPGLEGALSRALGQQVTTQSAGKLAGLVAARAAKAGLEEIPEELLTQAAANLTTRFAGVDPERAVLSPEEAADVIVQSFLAGGAGNIPGGVAGLRRPKDARELMRNYPIGSTAKLAGAGESLPQDAKVAGYQGMDVVVDTAGGRKTVGVDQLVPEHTPYEHSSGFAGEWAAQNPEAAKSLAEKSKPSIADFKTAGLNPRGTSAGQREQFAKWVGDAVPPDAPPKSSDVNDTGFLTPPVQQPQRLQAKGPGRITDRMKTTLLNRGFGEDYVKSLLALPPEQGAAIAQGIIENRKGTRLGKKPDEVAPTNEGAVEPSTEARKALTKYVFEFNQRYPKNPELLQSDAEYMRLKEAADSEMRSNAAKAAGQSRRETMAEREAAQAAIEEGDINSDNVKFAPLNQMEPELADKFRTEAKRLFDESESDNVRAALQKIIDGDDVNAGGAVEAQKERIRKILAGELDQRNAWTRNTEAPRPADAVATGLLKSSEQRQADIDEAIQAVADGTPNTIVDEDRAAVAEELNADRDIDLPYLEPSEQQILDKIDEIAERLGVENKHKPIIEGMEDDSFDFGANVDEKKSDAPKRLGAKTEEQPVKTYRELLSKSQYDEGDRAETESHQSIADQLLLDRKEVRRIALDIGVSGLRKDGEWYYTKEDRDRILESYSYDSDISAIGRASEIMAKVRRDAQQRDLEDYERSLSGVNFKDRGIDPSVADKFDAHGLAAQDLQSLLENGIDAGSPFHTAKVNDPVGGLGLRDHQPFVVVGHPGKGLKEGGIRAVVVDPLHAPSIPDLQKAFPGVEFIPAENAATELARIAKEGGAGTVPPKSSATDSGTKQAAETPKESGPARLGSKSVAERYKDLSGHELGEVVTSLTDEQKAAVEFFKARGKEVKFFRSPSGTSANSLFDPVSQTAYLNADEKGNSLNYLIGHEYAHASGADGRLADLPKDVLDQAKAYYLKRSAPNYREKSLQNEDLLTREAAAVLVGRVFEDEAYRAKIRNDHPGLIEKIVEYVKSLFNRDGEKMPEHVRRIIEELNKLPEQSEPPRRRLGRDRYDTYAGFAEQNRGTASGELGQAVKEKMGVNEKPTVTTEQWAKGAAARFNRDPVKARADVEAAFAAEGPLSDEMTVLASVVKSHLGAKVARDGTADEIEDFQRFQEAFTRKRSAAGRSLRAGQEDVFESMKTEDGRQEALAGALTRLSPQEQRLLDRAVKRLKDEGIDPNDIQLSEGFHGTPHAVDRFSTSKIGTGEGGQKYGWGLYFSSKDEVARSYRDQLSSGERTLAQKARDAYDESDSPDDATDALLAMNLTDAEKRLVEVLQNEGWLGFDYPHQAIKAAMRNLDDFDPTPELREAVAEAKKPQGNLYKVDLKPQEDEYLDWDKPMAKQSAVIKKAFGLDKILPAVAPLGNRLKVVESEINKILDSDDYGTDQLYKLEDERDSLVEKIRELTPIENTLDGWYYPDIQMTGGEKYESLSQKLSDRYVSWIDEEGAAWAASDLFPNESDEDSSEMIANAIHEMKSELKGVPITYETRGRNSFAKIGDHEIQIEFKASPGGDRKASEYLLSRGIRGTTYIGDYQKSGGKGAKNYVVFDDRDIGDPELMLSESGDWIRKAFDETTPQERQRLGAAKKAADKSQSLFEGRSAEEAYRAVKRAIALRQAEFRKLMVKKGIIPKSPADYDKMIRDPLATQAAIIQINAYKSTLADRVLEYWYNAVLSAPTTHVKNITGNTLNAGRMAANGFAKIVLEVAALQKKPTHAVQEVASFWSGFKVGLPEAMKNFKSAWSTELSALARQVGREKRSSPLEWAEGVAQIPGWWGKNVVRFPKRLMLATDEFFKTLVVHTNVNVEAHRLAVAAGLEGAELARKQAELVADPTSDAWSNAYDTALEVALQEEGGTFRKWLRGHVADLRRAPLGIGYASKFLVPFTNIAINSAAQVGAQSPLGLIPLLARPIINKYNGDPLMEGMSDRFARQAVGLATTALIYSMVGDEDDDAFIKIVGKDVKDSRIPRYSIGIGDSWFQYSGIEPLGSMIGLIADATKSLKKGTDDWMKVLGETATSVGNQLAEKPLLGALSDMAAFLTAKKSEQTTSEKAVGAMMDWAGRFGGSFIPAVAKVPLRASRDESPERRGWQGNDTAETLARIGDRSLARTDLGLIQEAAKFDRWGNKYPETSIPGHPISDFIFRALSPGKLVHFQPHAGDKLLANWNNSHPNEEYTPSELDPSYTFEGQKHYFTDAEFGRYAERTGKLAAKLFELGDFDVANPTAEQVDALKDNFTAARTAMKQVMQAEVESGKIETPDYDRMARDIAWKSRETARRKLGEGMGRAPERETEAGWNRRFEKLQNEKEQARQRLGRVRV